MAVHFSKEEQDLLNQDQSEIYKKRTKESEAEERKNMTSSDKLKQFRDYYLKYVILGLVILAILVIQIRDIKNKEKVQLFISIQGEVIEDQVIEELEKELAEYLGYQGREVVRITQENDDYQIQTYLYTGTTDLFIASYEDFSEWAKSDYFLANGFRDEVDFYSDYDEKYQFRSQVMSGEDIRNSVDHDNIEPSDKTEYLVGLSLQDSEKYKQMGGIITDPVLGITAAGKHPEDARKIAQFFMDNSKVMQTKADYLE